MEFYCMIHLVFAYVSSLTDGVWQRLPPFSVDEFRAASIHIMFAEANLKNKILPETTCHTGDAYEGRPH